MKGTHPNNAVNLYNALISYFLISSLIPTPAHIAPKNGTDIAWNVVQDSSGATSPLSRR